MKSAWSCRRAAWVLITHWDEMLTFRPFNKLFFPLWRGCRRSRRYTLWPGRLNTPPPNAKLSWSLLFVGFTARTSTASCRTARMTARRPRGGDCFIYCRLWFRPVRVSFSRTLNAIFFGSNSQKNPEMIQRWGHKAFAQYWYLSRFVKSADCIWLLVAFACLIGVCSGLFFLLSQPA